MGSPGPSWPARTIRWPPLIAGDDAAAAPLHSQVLQTGKAVVYPHIQDENALGVTAAGQPVLAVLGPARSSASPCGRVNLPSAC